MKEDVKEITSKQLIGNPELRYKELHDKNWEWSSFYNGWIEGRADFWGNDYKLDQKDEGVKPRIEIKKKQSGTDSIMSLQFEYCGSCDELLDQEYDIYCAKCGSKIKWSEEE